MMLSLGTRRRRIVQKIPTSRHAEAFGTYCMSRSSAKAKSDNPSHVLNRWLKEGNRESILSSCAALLGYDQSGNIMVLSAPRFCTDENSSNGEVYIIAQRGNAVRFNNLVSIPAYTLHQSVVGFIPENASCLLPENATVEMETEGLAKDSSCKGIHLTTHGSSQLRAQLPIVIPLGFGHGIDEDLSVGMIRLKLAASHPYYSVWIDSTACLCDSLIASGLQVNASVSESSASSLLISPFAHQEGSLPWIELHPDLDRIRHENLERFLDNNKEYYEETQEKATPNELHAGDQTCPLQANQNIDNSVVSVEETNEPHGRKETDEKEPPSLRSCEFTILNPVPSPKFVARLLIPPPQAGSPSGCKKVADLEGWKEDDVRVPGSPRRKEVRPAGLLSVSPTASTEAPVEILAMLDGPMARSDNITPEAQVSYLPRLKDNGSTGSGVCSVNLPSTMQKAALGRKAAHKQQLNMVDSGILQPKEMAADMSTLREGGTRKRPPTATLLEEPTKKQKSWGGVEDKILNALAEFRAMKMHQPSKLLVAFFAGYANPASAAFTKSFKRLEEGGLLTASRGGVGVTTLGEKHLPTVNAPRTNADVHKRLLSIIQKKQLKAKKLKELFDELSDGNVHDIKEVASSMGYSNVNSLGFKEAIGALNRFNFIIHDKSRKTLQLPDILFPFSENSPGEELDDEHISNHSEADILSPGCKSTLHEQAVEDELNHNAGLSFPFSQKMLIVKTGDEQGGRHEEFSEDDWAMNVVTI